MRSAFWIVFYCLWGGVVQPLHAESVSEELQKYNRSIDEAQREHDAVKLGKALSARTVIYYNNAMRDSIMIRVPQDMEKLKSFGQWDRYYEIWTYLVNTYIYYSNSKNTALREVQTMFNDALARKNDYGMGIAYYAMGNVYLNMNSLDESADAYRKGLDILRKAGGLHQFNTWDRPILTDSGGFQVFSLTGIRKLREEGCEFRSHIDGSKHIFTPENVMDTERIIGADIMMALDECPPGQSDYQYAKKSLGLTQRWLERCVKRFNETEPLYGYNQTLFPIVQGCTYKDLRQDAAKHVVDTLGKLNDGGGASIGGLAVGEPTEVMYDMIEVVNEILPKDRPRYLMGVGTPQNILEAIERGVDMFDCVMPTRNGRNAMLFTYEGTMNMRNQKWQDDFSPIDPDGCDIDRLHSKAYLHHLFKAQELLAMQIASIHNLAFYLRLVTDARTHIEQGDFVQWKRSVIDNLGRRR